MSKLVPPHGRADLNPRLCAADERAEETKRAQTLKPVPMTSREASDLVMLAMGAYSPLPGFMGEADWRRCCENMSLADGLFWPIPVTLSATEEVARDIDAGDEVALIDGDGGAVMGVMTVAEKYAIDRETEARHVYGTTDTAHPGVEKVMAQGAVNLGGPVTALSEGDYPDKYPDLFIRPAEARALFADKGWSRVAAFQTRNPMHRSHEHLVKIALEVSDGVFIHQVLGKLKDGDIPAEVRTRAIQAMIDGYFVPGSVIQAGYPIEMRYAGPREALFHALIRQNFGCSHLIVGRDHAGVGDFYGPFDSQHAFDDVPPEALITEALKIDITFFCTECDGMATAKTCPHGPEHHTAISGTEQRRRLAAGEDLPPEFARPAVVEILRAYYASLT